MVLRSLGATLILVAASLSFGSGQPGWTAAIKQIPSPAAAGSGQPQLSSSARGVLLSWIEHQGQTATLTFAELAGDSWSAPRVVASGNNWFVNWADVPSVLRLDESTLAAHWLQKSGAGTYAYDVRLAFSRDNGATWSPSTTPHHDGTQTEHGFASLFPLPDSGLGLVWLDGRAMQGAKEGHAGHGGGEMSLRFASFDRGGKQTAERVISSRVCECCPTSAAVTAGAVIAAYRNRSSTEVRDIFISRFNDGAWTSPAAVHDDNWKIPACPVNGPMLSARGRDVAVSWFTMRGEQGQSFASFSSDAGERFGKPIRLDESGSMGRVDIELLTDGSAVASYIESGDAPQFRIRRIQPSGDRSAWIRVAEIESSRASGYPRIAAVGNTLVLAWIERGRIATALAAMP